MHKIVSYIMLSISTFLFFFVIYSIILLITEGIRIIILIAFTLFIIDAIPYIFISTKVYKEKKEKEEELSSKQIKKLINHINRKIRHVKHINDDKVREIILKRYENELNKWNKKLDKFNK